MPPVARRVGWRVRLGGRALPCETCNDVVLKAQVCKNGGKNGGTTGGKRADKREGTEGGKRGGEMKVGGRGQGDSKSITPF
jgi:hypothetical protein